MGESIPLSTEQDIIKTFIGTGPRVEPPAASAPRQGKFSLDVITAVRKASAELQEVADIKPVETEKPKEKVTDRDKDSIRRQFGLPTKSATRKKAEQLFAKHKPYVPAAKRRGWE